jgi:hypothetical protein
MQLQLLLLQWWRQTAELRGGDSGTKGTNNNRDVMGFKGEYIGDIMEYVGTYIVYQMVPQFVS